MSSDIEFTWHLCLPQNTAEHHRQAGSGNIYKYLGSIGKAGA